MDFFSTKIAYASFDSFLGNVKQMIVDPLITLLFALAVVYFLYGLVEFMMNQDNDEKKTTGKSHMVWGVVGIAIMISVFAILTVIIDTFEIKGVNPKTGEVDLKL